MLKYVNPRSVTPTVDHNYVYYCKQTIECSMYFFYNHFDIFKLKITTQIKITCTRKLKKFQAKMIFLQW